MPYISNVIVKCAERDVESDGINKIGLIFLTVEL